MRKLGLFLAMGILGASPLWAEPQRVPLVLELPAEWLAKLTPAQKQLVDSLTQTLAQEITIARGFTVDLPTPLWDGPEMVLGTPWYYVNADEHIRALAFDGDSRRPLSGDQLDSIRQESLFRVEDPRNPGQFDVWVIRTALHKGDKAIRVSFRQSIGRALQHIVFDFPKTFFGDSGPTMRQGVRNILFGARNTLGLLVGLSETRPSYTPEQVEQEILSRRESFMRAGLSQGEFEGNYVPQLTEEEQAKAQSILELAAQSAPTREHLASYQPNASVEELEKQREAAFLSAVRRAYQLDAIRPGLSFQLHEHGRALLLLREAQEQFEKDVEAFRVKRRATLLEENRLGATVKEWLEREIDESAGRYVEMERGPRYQKVADQLDAEGLRQAAGAVRGALDFFANEEGAIRETLEAETEPSRRFEPQKYRIWRHSHWVKAISTSPDGPAHWTGEGFDSFPEVYTDAPGWRLQHLWQLTYALFKGGVFQLQNELAWNGNYGLKSLTRVNPFPYLYMVDPKTSEVVADTSKLRPTLLSRLADRWKSAQKARADFDAARDLGDWSKNWAYPFHYFYHQIWRSFIVNAASVPLHIARVGLNVAAAQLGTAASPLWAPALGAGTMAWSALIQDHYGSHQPKQISSSSGTKDNPRFTATNLPVEQELGRMAKGTALFSAAWVRAGWHLSCAVGSAAKGLAICGAEKTRDFLTRTLIHLSGAKIPAQDPSWFFHRTQGPGVKDGYYFQPAKEAVMAEVVQELDTLDWQLFDKLQTVAMLEPAIETQGLLAPLGEILGAEKGVPKIGGDSPLSRALVNEKLRAELKAFVKPKAQQLMIQRGAIDAVEARRNDLTHLTQEDLMWVLDQTTALTRRHFKARYITGQSERVQAAFWKNLGLTDGDWLSLGRALLRRRFGKGIETALEEKAPAYIVPVRTPEGWADGVSRVLEQEDAQAAQAPRVSLKAEAPYEPLRPGVLCRTRLAQYAAYFTPRAR